MARGKIISIPSTLSSWLMLFSFYTATRCRPPALSLRCRRTRTRMQMRVSPSASAARDRSAPMKIKEVVALIPKRFPETVLFFRACADSPLVVAVGSFYNRARDTRESGCIKPRSRAIISKSADTFASERNEIRFDERREIVRRWAKEKKL